MKTSIKMLMIMGLVAILTACNNNAITSPVIDAGADTSVIVNTQVDINGTASDSDGNIVDIDWSENGSTISTSLNFSYTPTTVGDHKLTLTVTDDDGAIASDTMVVSASNIQVTLKGYVIDDPVVGATIAVYDNNGNLIKQKNALTDTNGFFSIDVDFRDSYEVRAYKGKLGNGKLFVATISNYCNSNNKCYITPYTTLVNILASKNNLNQVKARGIISSMLGIDGDPYINNDIVIIKSLSLLIGEDGASLEQFINDFIVDIKDGFIDNVSILKALENAKGRTPTPNPTPNPDPNPTPNPTPVPNNAPSVDAGTDKSVTVNTQVDMNGTASDSDGTIVSYDWSEDGTTISDSANFSYTPTTVGDHELTLTVMDDDGATGTDTVIVTATEVNNAPTCEDFTIDAGGVATHTEDLSTHISDADGDSMTVNFVESGVVGGDPVIDNANTGITGTDAKVTITQGGGDVYIDYSVSDGTDTSTTCRLTIGHVDGN